MKDQLQNYLLLRAKVDALCVTVAAQLEGHLACGPGCAACCRALELFPVEARVLAAAFAALPIDKQAVIRRNQAVGPETACPFLDDDLCLVYEARPIICRTHGLPILLEDEGGQRVAFCPKNCIGLESLPGSAVIQLEQLNTILVAINQAFVAEVYGDLAAPERMSMAEIIGG